MKYPLNIILVDLSSSKQLINGQKFVINFKTNQLIIIIDF